MGDGVSLHDLLESVRTVLEEVDHHADYHADGAEILTSEHNLQTMKCTYQFVKYLRLCTKRKQYTHMLF